jgi:hypothetical protein
MSETKSIDERARLIYDEMMEILQKRGDDKAVVHAVLVAFYGAYCRFMEENGREERPN